MNPESTPAKVQLRRHLREIVRALPPDEIRAASDAARGILRQQSVWRDAKAVLFYAPIPGEIDLWPLARECWDSGRTVALPRFIAETGAYAAYEVTGAPEECAAGKFGILEPARHCRPLPLKQLDFVLAPGVAFDQTGHRLGRGQGFYDRLLAQFNGIKCGVAFDQQLLPQVPREAHDVRMNFILTPTRWLETPGSHS
jgi:5-formyltetrahydrofolate cyclo-ligase